MKLTRFATTAFFSLFIAPAMANGDRYLVGGYERMENAEVEDDDQVHLAAAFAVQALTSTAASSSSSSSSESDALPMYGFRTNLPAEIPSEYIHIVRAFRQVVAGLNYRMVVALSHDENCYGAFAVTIYDRFGDMSVTQWGQEIECARAMAALENDDLNDATAAHFDD